jgi:hypothetical protein
MTSLLLLAALAWADDEPPKDASILKQEFTIKARNQGPKLAIPSPSLGPAFAQEVIETLDLGRGKPGATIKAPLPKLKERLARPFPTPPYLAFKPKPGGPAYDRWGFEVWGREQVWQQSGEGALTERVDWDGSAFSGGVAARVEQPFFFRFRGYKGQEVYILESEPIVLKSMYYAMVLGDRRMEVATSLLFKDGTAEWPLDAVLLLGELSDRLRRVTLGANQPYHLILYQKTPGSALSQKRAKALRKHLSEALFVAPAKIMIDLKPVADRGEALVCLLPAEGR